MNVGANQVTVLVPVWGTYAGPGLAEALASLTEQDFPARIIVIDNASDSPVEVPGGVDVARTPERLTLGGARNFGLTHVSTPFVLVWDADDVMLPGTLRSLNELLQGAPDRIAVAATIIDETTGERYRWPRNWTTHLVRFPRLFGLMQCVWSAYPTTGATLMRTEIVREAGGYSDEISGSDWGLGAALAFRGRLAWSDRPGRIYRPRAGSVWDQNSSMSRMLAHSRSIRGRLREDTGVPAWARAMLPAVALAQYLALFVVRPPLLLARRIRRLTRSGV
jgi:glycosyltransferase involved in cell wall biosynthesis